MPDNTFNVRAVHKGNSGFFYFGTPKGIVWFKPEAIVIKQAPPPIKMINLLVNEKKADISTSPEYITKLSLQYDQNNLFFRFRGIDFSHAEKVTYAYQLEGWDRDWIYSKQLNEVRYNHLPPGSYEFKIKAAIGSGAWSTQPYIVTVTILPPFWRQWWFFGLVGVFILATAILLTRYIVQRKLRQQLRELEKQRAIEAERNRISKDMHDEIGSGLTHIALMSELIQTQQKAEKELLKDVSTISASARRLVQSMSEIVWALNPQHDTLENLLAYLREQTTAYFEPFHYITYHIDFPDEVPALKLSNEQRRNLFLVVKEALNNALKHAGANCIQLKMKLSADNICFMICDNGRGFNHHKTRLAANGLKNMEKRMADVGGSFRLETGTAGTTVTAQLPIANRMRKGRTTFFTSPKKR